MSTVQDAIDLARVDLNDADKARWSDLELLGHFNAALRLTYQIRPDLRFGNYGSGGSDLLLKSTFPISDDYLRALADFVVARANASETDDSELNRATTFMTSFRAMLGVG